ncbi:hypothetical protein M9434_002113 [Picochlorum sp. BPE23]|nr:hypothetical protein M9434_002113 [Picochlorum sp. BPE23]
MIQTLLGKLPSRQNAMAWVVAGTLAYVLYVKPQRQLEQEQRMADDALARLKSTGDVTRTAPVPDPQETGLVLGKREKKTSNKETATTEQ